MKLVMFRNESGDDAYPVCYYDVDTTKEQLVEFCKHLVGDDYDGEFVYGEFYVEEVKDDLPKLTDIIKEL